MRLLRIMPRIRTHSAVLLIALLSLAGPVSAYTPAEIDNASLNARDIDIVSQIANDAYLGRDNNTPGSTAIQAVLIAALDEVSEGINDVGVGPDKFKHNFSTSQIGTNLLAVIPGTDLADSFVMIGAHYDHLGSSGSTIYNGATDNAAGVAMVIAVGKAIASLPHPPRRSVILALWDAEEDGLVGSAAYVNSLSPVFPMPVAYVNLDIQGANLLPALRSRSFVIGAESGGPAFQNLIQSQVALEGVDTRRLSRMFGQDRSDHANFLAEGVPSAFFSDAPGACYHTPNDKIGVVDLDKLREESQLAFRVVLALAESPTAPTFVPTSLLANTFADALEVQSFIAEGVSDLGLFAPSQQTTILNAQATVQAIVNDGPGNYPGSDQIDVGLAALDVLNAIATLPCQGYQLPTAVPLGPATGIGLALALSVSGCLAHGRGAKGARR